MRKLLRNYLRLSSLFLVLTMSLISCDQESMQDNPISVDGQKVRLRANMEEESSPASSTRTILADDGHSILWSSHDQIKVFVKQGSNVSDGSLFESLNEEPSKNADFEGVLDISNVSAENPIYAVYPYSEGASFDGTSLTTSLASEQVAKIEGFADNL